MPMLRVDLVGSVALVAQHGFVYARPLVQGSDFLLLFHSHKNFVIECIMRLHLSDPSGYNRINVCGYDPPVA